MNLTRDSFNRAVSEADITTDHGDVLWKALEDQVQDRPGFSLAHLIYYLGALIVISAMTWFMTEAWERYSDSAILVTSTIYAGFFILAGRYCNKNPVLNTAGGLLVTLAVCMTPLAIYGLERVTGFWPQSAPGITEWFTPEVRIYRYPFEIGSIIAGLIALKFLRFPLLTVPIMLALWGLTLDTTSYLLGYPQLPELNIQWTGLWFGLLLLAAAYLIDQRTKEDFAFWVYFGGLSAFWLGLSFMKFDSEGTEFVYCLINVGLILFSILLARRAFFVFGGLGIMVYLGHLATLFHDSLLFPVMLSAIGIGILLLGVQYQRFHGAIERSIVDMVPNNLRRLLPRERTE